MKFRLISISHDSAETVLVFQKSLDHGEVLDHPIEQATVFNTCVLNMCVFNACMFNTCVFGTGLFSS